MEERTADELKKLHTAAIDARNGYEEALEDAKGRGLTGLFREMIELHARNAVELEEALDEAGLDVAQHGSLLGVVHKTIMSVRSLFGGLDESVLPGLIDGEERNLKRYDDALAVAGDGGGSLRTLLVTQRDRIAAKVAAMKDEREQGRVATR
jgi:uncharacterized protein (TIGR02284 family)